MKEKIINISKKQWIYAHILLLCFSLFFTVSSDIGTEPTFSKLGGIIFTILFSIAAFPSSPLMLFPFNNIFYLFHYPFIGTIIFYGLSILYYILWLRKDSTWSPKNSMQIVYIRLVWFSISVLSSLLLLMSLTI